VTWQKGAKRQMANLDRFLEELENFDRIEISQETIKTLEEMSKKIEFDDQKHDGQTWTEALDTLYNWIKGVIKYHSLMLKRVKPLKVKVEEIEHEVKEADQKLNTLNKKSEVS
jgi:dynein heavy chain